MVANLIFHYLGYRISMWICLAKRETSLKNGQSDMWDSVSSTGESLGALFVIGGILHCLILEHENTIATSLCRSFKYC